VKQPLSRFPGFPKALEGKEKHNHRREKHHKEPAASQSGSLHVLSVFLYRSKNEQNAQGKKYSADKLQPELAQCSKKVGKDNFEFSDHGGC
jgi:hypothetical protein